MTLMKTLMRTSNGYVENMAVDYTCWRITGELLKSIESCPDGTLNECMHLEIGDLCPGGNEIKI